MFDRPPEPRCANNRVDIIRTQHTLSAVIDQVPVMWRFRGQGWTVAADAPLGDIITAACTLMEFDAPEATP